MHIRHRNIDEIEEGDLLELIHHKDSESKIIDYKKELPKDNQEGKKEFLYDVSSFANTSGGHLIYGMDEEKGIPIKIEPIDLDDPDKKILELDNRIRDGIEPRIPKVEIGEVQIGKGSVLVVRIERSYSAPHRVTLGGSGKFYGRNSRGKYPLNVHDLRSAFILSETIGERVRNFRKERIEMIRGRNTPVPLTDGVRLVLHLLPLDAFALAHTTSIQDAIKNRELLEPMGMGGTNAIYNFDGYLLHQPGQNKSNEHVDLSEGSFYLSRAYTQYFRNGCIESVKVLDVIEDNIINGGDVEGWIRESLPRYLDLAKTVGTKAPILIMVSLLNVRGCKIAPIMGSGTPILLETSLSPPPQGIVQENLLLPEILLEDYDDNIATHLYSIFNIIWNAGGWSKSPIRS